MIHRAPFAVAAALLLASGCSSASWVKAVDRSSATTTTLPLTPSGQPGGDAALDARGIVTALASDELAGRDNRTPGSAAARDLIIGQLSQFAQPVFPEAEGIAGYLQEFGEGTNILAVIPGGELAGEFVVIGAHYDHIGSECPSAEPADHTCNGATDNATGTAVVVSVARAIAAEGTPRRSVLIALWDSEEDGLLGSSAYSADPVVPFDQMVTYLNFDVQGATLLPSLADVTIAVGAETGGVALAQASATAVKASTLDPLPLSSFLFYGRSDHFVFASEFVPSMLLTDAVGGCYHTAQDEVDIVNFAKLDQQITIGSALVRELASTDAAPQFELNAPLIVFADVVALLEFAERAEPDLGLLAADAAARVRAITSELRAVVDAGAEAFDNATSEQVLQRADALMEAFTESACASFAG